MHAANGGTGLHAPKYHLVAGDLREAFTATRTAVGRPKSRPDPLKKPSPGAGTRPKTKETPPVRLRCVYCDVELTMDNAMKCGKCRAAVYCDRECQINDWKEHRLACKKG